MKFQKELARHARVYGHIITPEKCRPGTLMAAGYTMTFDFHYY